MARARRFGWGVPMIRTTARHPDGSRAVFCDDRGAGTAPGRPADLGDNHNLQLVGGAELPRPPAGLQPGAVHAASGLGVSGGGSVVVGGSVRGHEAGWALTAPAMATMTRQLANRGEC